MTGPEVRTTADISSDFSKRGRVARGGNYGSPSTPSSASARSASRASLPRYVMSRPTSVDDNSKANGPTIPWPGTPHGRVVRVV
jgi:hypothetical protein